MTIKLKAGILDTDALSLNVCECYFSTYNVSSFHNDALSLHFVRLLSEPLDTPWDIRSGYFCQALASHISLQKSGYLMKS